MWVNYSTTKELCRICLIIQFIKDKTIHQSKIRTIKMRGKLESVYIMCLHYVWYSLYISVYWTSNQNFSKKAYLEFKKKKHNILFQTTLGSYVSINFLIWFYYEKSQITANSFAFFCISGVVLICSYFVEKKKNVQTCQY